MARPRKINLTASVLNEVAQIKLVLENTPESLLAGVVESITTSLSERRDSIDAALAYVRKFDGKSGSTLAPAPVAVMPRRGPGRPPRNATAVVAKAKSSGGRELSPEARAAIVAGQAKRWAKVRKEKAAAAKAAKAKAAAKAAAKATATGKKSVKSAQSADKAAS